MTSFLQLGLAEPLARALAEEKYTDPTPIQAQTIPEVLASRDVIGIAQTGTGKTAAFALPILHHLSKTKQRLDKRTCRVLVLSPTRELSAQIVDSFQTYGRHVRPRVSLAIGGVPINRQVRDLVSGVDVLVATPGRLRDLMQIGAVTLDRVEIFVLDEADRMLDMGFIHDIRAVVGKLPARRQSLFFSATMPREIADLAKGMLRDPVRVAVTPEATTAEKVDQRIIHVDRAGKPALLVEVLGDAAIDRALVFTRTKHGADKVVRALEKAGVAAEAIHGNKSQSQRERALASFRAGRIRTLIATDIAARGIDVDGISHVVNYDLPNIPESYVHRIGRTARAGTDGIAISFCDGEERAYLRDIEKLIRMSIPAERRGRSSAQSEGQAEAEPESAAPRHQRNGKPQRHRHHDRPQQGRAQQGRPQQGRSQQERSQQERPRQERPEQGRPRQGRPQQGRPQQGRPQQDRREAPRNAHPARDGGHAESTNRGWTPLGNDRAARPQRAPADAGDMTAIAFMKQRRRGGPGRHAPTHRAPR